MGSAGSGARYMYDSLATLCEDSMPSLDGLNVTFRQCRTASPGSTMSVSLAFSLPSSEGHQGGAVLS